MITRSARRISVLLLVFTVFAAPLHSHAAGNYLLATASPGGTYYPVGVALSTLVKVKLQGDEGISMTARTSAGSAENIRLLADGKVQFAILQGLFGAYAWNGTGPMEHAGPERGLRAVTMLWQNVEHFLINERHVRTGDISDALAINGVAGFGKEHSGSLGSSRKLFANLGVDIDRQFDIFYGGYAALAGAMQDGKANLVGMPGGVPVGAVSKLMASQRNDVRLLSLNAEQVAKADGGMNLWTPYLIPAQTYPGQTRPVSTIAQPNVLMVREDVPDEDVYLITKTIFENLGFLRSIHKATQDMAVEKAIIGLPAPLHPGAARYYHESGLHMPARLLAP